MPFIEVHMAARLTEPRKRQLIRDIVQVTHEAIGSDPKIINVVGAPLSALGDSSIQTC